jgi:hypothetical protein
MIIRTAAPLDSLPHRESTVQAVERGFLVLTEISPSFPYPVPAAIRVPQWALIDVTVRHSFLVIAAH